MAAVEATVANLAANDPEPSVRAAAIMALGQTLDKKYVPVYEKGLTGEQPYSILGASLDALSRTDPEAAVKAGRKLENEENESIVMALAQLFATAPDRESLPWFQKQAAKVDNMLAFGFYDSYANFLLHLNDPALLDQAVENFSSVAYDSTASLWRRFANTKAIADFREYYRGEANKEKVDALTKLLADIREKETDPKTSWSRL